METRKVAFRQFFNRPQDVDTGEALVLVLDNLQAHRLEMEDVHFHSDSAVLLPDPRRDATEGTQAEDLVTGLAVLKAVYFHAKSHPAQKLLIAGHTDTTGADGYNLTLSKLRADSVLYALMGDRENWAKISVQKYKVEDYQLILRWAADDIGWDCNPGAVDDVPGPKTSAALRAFKQRYNDELGAKLTVDRTVEIDTWQAFFDVYMLKLKGMLGVDDAGLGSMRNQITFLDAGRKTVGCGESHPIEAKGVDEFRSATNRRVELLFFDPGNEPKFPCHPGADTCKPDLCELYRNGFFEFQKISPATDGQAIFRLRKIATDEPAAGVTAVIEMPDGSTVEKVADGDGVVKLDGVLGQRFRLVRIIDDKERLAVADVDTPSAIV